MTSLHLLLWIIGGVLLQIGVYVRNDYSRYTCNGCHEHTPDNIRREHVEVGIRQFDNCVECHRSGNKHDIKGGKAGNPVGRDGNRNRRERD